MGNKSFQKPSECEFLKTSISKANLTNNYKKTGLFSEEKLFENYDSISYLIVDTNIYGYRLHSDPEERNYYLNCINCGKLNLDTGITNEIKYVIILNRCKHCFTLFDTFSSPDNIITKSNSEKTRSPHTFEMITKFIKKPFIFKSKIKKELKKLTNLVLICDKDTLLPIFMNNECINYELIIKQILLPYFKIKSRVLKQGNFFKIGEVHFKIEGMSPTNKGVVCSQTYIQCSSYFTTTSTVSRVLLITTKKQNDFIEESLIKEIMFESNNQQVVIIKDNIVKIKEREFYVRNSEPPSGLLTNETYITIENKEIFNIDIINIAVLTREEEIKDQNEYKDYIIKEYFNPFFLSGNTKYIERGDQFNIENLELFVLNSYPEQGYINKESHVTFSFGLTKEECLDKIVLADSQFAISLSRLQGEEDINRNILQRLSLNYREMNSTNPNFRTQHTSFSFLINNNQGNRFISNEDDHRLITEFIHSQDEIMNSNLEDPLQLNSMSVNSLPTFKIDEQYFQYMQTNKKNECYDKCVICMYEFEMDQLLKTMPCFHVFHEECLDKWLNNSYFCPICKSDLS